MAKSKRFWRYDKNGIKTEVQYGTNSDNVDIGDENLTEVITSIRAANNESLKYQGNYANGASLDYFNDDMWYGIWRIGAAYEPSDLPIGRSSNENVLLVVTKAYGNSSSYCKQELIYTKQNLSLFRFCSDSTWSNWQIMVGANTAVKNGRQIVTFSAGSRGSLFETGISIDDLLRADVINNSGDFIELSLPYPESTVNNVLELFSTGSYYDLRSNIEPSDDGLGHYWQPLVGTGDSLFIESGDFDHNRCVMVGQHPIILPDTMFNSVTNYSNAASEFKFRIVVIADVPMDTAARTIMSLFNGNTTVQRHGVNGFRIVSKRGANGNSMATSSYIYEGGLCAIALEGSNKAGDMVLTVCPLNNNFAEVSPGLSSVTLSRTDNTYVGTYKQGANYLIDASSVTDGIPVFAVYTETAKGTATLSKLMVSEIIAKIQTALKPKQAEVATVDYVNDAVKQRTFQADVDNAGTATKLKTKRTIALSGGVTGTATAFDGSANISIPVTAVLASKITGSLNSGASVPWSCVAGKPSNATTSSDGFMSSADKIKLNGIASGAQKNTITGIKGNAESSYRTGNVNLTAENILGYTPSDFKNAEHIDGSTGADLNNYTEEGIYWYNYSPKNSPSNNSVGGLIVMKSSIANITQLDFPSLVSNGNDPSFVMYGRTYRNGNWSSWKKVAFTDDIPKIDSALSSTSTNPVQNKVVNAALAGKAATSHTHTKAQITDFPSSLKNPNALTIQLNGTSQGVYDGSSAKTINVTKSSIGLSNVENKSSATIRNEITAQNVIDAVGYTPANRFAALLTNQNLDTFYGASYWGNTYYAIGGNTVTGKPSGVGNFAIKVIRTGDGVTSQVITTVGGDIYIRYHDSSQWQSWQKLIFTSDIATTSTAGLMSASDKIKVNKIDSIEDTANIAHLHFGVCSTAAATSAKTVTISGFTLTNGVEAYVYFTTSNTATSPTLNISGTGAKTLRVTTPDGTRSLGFALRSGLYHIVYYNNYYYIMGQTLVPTPLNVCAPSANSTVTSYLGYIANNSGFPTPQEDMLLLPGNYNRSATSTSLVISDATVHVKGYSFIDRKKNISNYMDSILNITNPSTWTYTINSTSVNTVLFENIYFKLTTTTQYGILSATSIDNNRVIKFKNCAFDVDSYRAFLIQSGCIEFENCSFFISDNTSDPFCLHMVEAHPTSSSMKTTVSFDNCYFEAENVYNTNIYAVALSGYDVNLSINNCEFINCNPFKVENSSSTTASCNLKITNNYFETNRVGAYNDIGSNYKNGGFIFNNNIWKTVFNSNNNIAGTLLVHGGRESVISNNTIITNATTFTVHYKKDSSSIMVNTFNGNTINANISLSSTGSSQAYLTVTGNTVAGTLSTGAFTKISKGYNTTS